nr:hypothetical protein [uncultured Rhodopila sp.]
MSQYSEEIGFAAGTLIATQVGSGGIVTPVKFGILQDVSLDFSADLKELYGQNRYAIALAPGKTKVEIKAKFAGIRGNLFNQVYFGVTATPTQTLFADGEADTIPASSTYTVVAANGSNFLTDEGVFYAAAGTPMTRVSTLTAAGQYIAPSGAPGTYTFDSADASLGVYLSYLYSSTAGVQLPISNVRMGVGPSFKIVLSQPFDGRDAVYIFNQCQAAKLSMPTKQDDYTIMEMDFMIAADSNGNIGSINTSL